LYRDEVTHKWNKSHINISIVSSLLFTVKYQVRIGVFWDNSVPEKNITDDKDLQVQN
jgi:hypothetical protein